MGEPSSSELRDCAVAAESLEVCDDTSPKRGARFPLWFPEPSPRRDPPLDGISAERFPLVNTAIIVANFLVWILYELPHLGSSVYHASFYPCTVSGSCHGPEPWEISWFTAMFMHGSWDHILGNMVFLAALKNVEDAFGRLRYLIFYIAGGFVANATKHRGDADLRLHQRVARAGAPPSGAIAAVPRAYIVLYPNSRVLGLLVIIPIRLPAWVFLGVWFLYQLFEANYGLFSASANGGGVRILRHVGGFLFGVMVAAWLVRAGTVRPQAANAPALRVGGRLTLSREWRPGSP